MPNNDDIVDHSMLSFSARGAPDCGRHSEWSRQG
jgi:hypothetical protein